MPDRVNDTLRRILTARVYDVARESELDFPRNYFKQHVFAFRPFEESAESGVRSAESGVSAESGTRS